MQRSGITTSRRFFRQRFRYAKSAASSSAGPVPAAATRSRASWQSRRPRSLQESRRRKDGTPCSDSERKDRKSMERPGPVTSRRCSGTFFMHRGGSRPESGTSENNPERVSGSCQSHSSDNQPRLLVIKTRMCREKRLFPAAHGFGSAQDAYRPGPDKLLDPVLTQEFFQSIDLVGISNNLQDQGL